LRPESTASDKGLKTLRADLERAMAAVITSPAERKKFEAEPARYAAEFGLDPLNAGRLERMAPDLVALTGSFVAKRSGMLRAQQRRTLSLLGPRGTRMVKEYVNRHPAVESFREEAARFGDFMVEETTVHRDGSAWSEVIAEMARFERARTASFWGAIEPFPDPAPGRARREQPQSVRLRSGIGVERFERDLRILYHDQGSVPAPPPPDPCVLAFMHSRTASGFRIVRLTDGEAELLSCLPGRVTVSDAARLVRLGVLECA
jgi:hypothetical protein